MIRNIQGGTARDHRGQIRFVNDFDMNQVRRFYIIKNADTEFVRGWRAHKIEQRWFYVLSGSFSLDLVAIDDWENPAKDTLVENMTLLVEDQRVLHVPAGYGTAFRALSADSELLVFADHLIEHAPHDDYTWPSDYFNNR